MIFETGDYVRLLQAPNTRMGALIGGPNDKGQFLFRQDPRFADTFPDSYVFTDEIEVCPRPTDAQVKAVNKLAGK